MKPFYSPWRHVFKLDPDRTLSDEALDRVCMSGTDAIMVGGSTGVTYDNTVELLSRVRQYEVPCVLEISNHEAVVPGFDLYMIPMVLNTTRAEWLIGHHQRAIRDYGYMMPWDQLVPEGYIIMNGDSAVARLTEAQTDLTAEEAVAYAQAGDRLLSLPIVYLEYSGTFGDMELLGRVKRSMHHSQLFYGGGIDSALKAQQAAALADTIVVGNIIYENMERALETVRAVK
ncbi:Heptaprenylglyceryl phosphate synthase [Paenibacillus sp. CECT 9249]|uniref:heptaprenylglyceryl phosphate synthase n=1 Tax=Paenibacillus sp. CECT 9249 TaxID=2845385 RepID=UPI001E32EF24|nr:heptaprenylglyceryl phosphate synthase [Paenibacillus sp. CECT 9249]CAH0121706.1 Heptaprenylglyceryl phosphate synthase [Paenibacillus sp. CECT 9249]